MSDNRVIAELFVLVLEKYGIEVEKQEDGRWKIEQAGQLRLLSDEADDR